MRLNIILFLLSVVTISAYSQREYETFFMRWMHANDKTYQHEEFFPRFNTFKANLDWIDSHNAVNKSFTVAMNKFGDLSTIEFRTKFCEYKPVPDTLLQPLDKEDFDSFFYQRQVLPCYISRLQQFCRV